MALIFIFLISTMASSSAATANERVDMLTIIGALKDFEHAKHGSQSSRSVFTDIDRMSNSDSIFDPMIGPTTANKDTNVDLKSKRGWEDFSKEWRRSPKRAWDVVRRLWKVPEIRSKYMHYLKNGKRSHEILENTPVHQLYGVGPSWTPNQYGDYNVDDALSEQRREYIRELLTRQLFPAGIKRGWEDLNMFKRRPADVEENIFTKEHSNKRGWEDLNMFKRGPEEEEENMFTKEHGNKRGWEDLLWKRNVNSLSEGKQEVANILSQIDTTTLGFAKLQPFDLDTTNAHIGQNRNKFDYNDALFEAQ